LQQRPVNFVVRFKEHITRSATPYRRLAKKDRLVRWRKPKPPQHVTAAQWEALPAELLLRQVSYVISCRSMRTRRVTILTSLLDQSLWGAEEFAELYRRRWRVELFLKDIKTTLKMETLRCLSPAMIRKELWMHLIAYNLIRRLIWTAADQKGVPLERISFKAAVSFLDQWLPLFIFATHSPRQQNKLFHALLRNLARSLVPLRPGRREPRAVKRRPKPFPLLTAPRQCFREIPHRGKRK
jgi:IS4 transposase